MNKLINIVLSGLLWRRYKFLLVSLILLILFVFIAGQIHQDYLAYAQSTENVSVGWSFAVKWTSWIVALLLFFGVNHLHNKRKQKQADLEGNNSALSRIMAWKKQSKSNELPSKPNNRQRSGQDANDGKQHDPFAHLRTKDKLRSYGDILIESHEDDTKKRN
ncbi:hypothetical protein PN836_019685 [Ningiella sp. W23]|uniref:hypothetical protein n=1 Tax=Ningiella sp. W23 TaxID=3023715 RepID=UPI0037569498